MNKESGRKLQESCPPTPPVSTLWYAGPHPQLVLHVLHSPYRQLESLHWFLLPITSYWDVHWGAVTFSTWGFLRMKFNDSPPVFNHFPRMSSVKLRSWASPCFTSLEDYSIPVFPLIHTGGEIETKHNWPKADWPQKTVLVCLPYLDQGDRMVKLK